MQTTEISPRSLRELLERRAQVVSHAPWWVMARRQLPAPIRTIGRHLLWTRYRARVRKLLKAAHTLGSTRVVYDISSFRGSFELDMRSHVTHQLLIGSFENAYVPIIEAILNHGDDFVDVGANVGLYTILGGMQVGPQGRVLSVEPAPTVLPLLQSNIRRNALEQVTLFEGVASSEPGMCTLTTIDGNEEYSSLSSIVHPAAPHRSIQRAVPAETLDNLITQHQLKPTLIKIDAEGAEGLVLRGATNALSTHKPIILSELDYRLLAPLNDTPYTVICLLISIGYSIIDATTGIEVSKERASEYVGEIVAIPSNH